MRYEHAVSGGPSECAAFANFVENAPRTSSRISACCSRHQERGLNAHCHSKRLWREEWRQVGAMQTGQEADKKDMNQMHQQQLQRRRCVL